MKINNPILNYNCFRLESFQVDISFGFIKTTSLLTHFFTFSQLPSVFSDSPSNPGNRIHHFNLSCFAVVIIFHQILHFIPRFLDFLSPPFELLSAAGEKKKKTCNHKYAACTNLCSQMVLNLYQKVLNLYPSFISTQLLPFILSTTSNLLPPPSSYQLFTFSR